MVWSAPRTCARSRSRSSVSMPRAITSAAWSWEAFWEYHQENTGDPRAEAVARLTELLGKNYREQPVCDLYLRDLLAEGEI